MYIPVIRIGNSRGIRLSKTILEKYRITNEVNLIMEEDRIIIEPVEVPRAGWEEAFREMNESNDDRLIIDDIFDDESIEEWK